MRRRQHNRWWRWGILLLLLLPRIALADAPITRGPEALPQGGGDSQPTAAYWQGVALLPPPGVPREPAPRFMPQTDPGGVSSAIVWLGRDLNPGNWVLDAGMGIFAGIVKTLTGLAQQAALTLIGGPPAGGGAIGPTVAPALLASAEGWSILPSGCAAGVISIVVCTPADLTYAHPGLQIVWHVLRSIAASLLTLMFIVRIGRMLADPPSLTQEGKHLLISFLAAMVCIQQSAAVGQVIIEFFNALNSRLLRLAQTALVLPTNDDLNLGANLLALLLWVLVLVLALKSFVRLARLIVLLAVLPLAGACLFDRATSARFGTWLGKLIETLLEQTTLVIVFVVAAAVVQPYAERGAGVAAVQTLLAIVVLMMALGGPGLIGIATGAGTGGAIGPLLTYGALRRGVQMIVPRPVPQRATMVERKAVAEDRGVSGDPRHSAAAQRATAQTAVPPVAHTRPASVVPTLPSAQRMAPPQRVVGWSDADAQQRRARPSITEHGKVRGLRRSRTVLEDGDV